MNIFGHAFLFISLWITIKVLSQNLPITVFVGENVCAVFKSYQQSDRLACPAFSKTHQVVPIKLTETDTTIYVYNDASQSKLLCKAPLRWDSQANSQIYLTRYQDDWCLFATLGGEPPMSISTSSGRQEQCVCAVQKFLFGDTEIPSDASRSARLSSAPGDSSSDSYAANSDSPVDEFDVRKV